MRWRSGLIPTVQGVGNRGQSSGKRYWQAAPVSFAQATKLRPRFGSGIRRGGYSLRTKYAVTTKPVWVVVGRMNWSNFSWLSSASAAQFLEISENAQSDFHFGSARRTVSDSNDHAEHSRQLSLDFRPPGPGSATIATAGSNLDELLGGRSRSTVSILTKRLRPGCTPDHRTGDAETGEPGVLPAGRCTELWDLRNE